jgi:hypothetical protein
MQRRKNRRGEFRFFFDEKREKEREKERQEDTFSKRHPKMFISPFLFFLFFKIQ